MILDRHGREDLSCGVEPQELGLFYNELMHIYTPLFHEFPNWKLSMKGSRTLESPVVSTAQLSCQYNKVPCRDADRSPSTKWLLLTIAIGGTDCSTPYFERADVQWLHQDKVPIEMMGTADLLNGDKPPVTDENVNRLLGRLPELYAELRRMMKLLN